MNTAHKKLRLLIMTAPLMIAYQNCGQMRTTTDQLASASVQSSTSAPSAPGAPMTGISDEFAAARQLLTQKCASCHALFATMTEEQFQSTASGAGKLVVPKDPTNSALFERVTRPQAAAGRMPAGNATPLTAQEISILETWILNFAKPGTVVLPQPTPTPAPVPGPFPPSTGSAQFEAAKAVLSKNNCFACHGGWQSYTEGQFLALSVDGTKFAVAGSPSTSGVIARVKSTNASVRMPQGMAALSPADIQTLETWISGISASTPIPTPSGPLTGEQLYANNCQLCHGPLATSERRGEDAGDIRDAIREVRDMRSRPGLIALTSAEIAKIADVLAGGGDD